MHGARIALDDDVHTARAVELNRAIRERLYGGLDRLGLSTVLSEANFVLADVALDADAIFHRLLRRGLIVRPVHEPRLRPCLRISTCSEEQVDLLLEALEEVLREERAAGRVPARP